ncbi:terminase small subunit [Trichocoleus desertorum]|uniref:Terminase small subunit n=1 Tax=Trichocoleus desertorum GB2-A4 TaxID=2933944 RepID=A0ABV0JCQ4_9CYAN|nr:terminase small subunit [Trichocoleus sp. FACHB-46]
MSESPPKLTDKQKRFCQEYLVDFDSTEAYKRAGYVIKSDREAASDAENLLRNPKIQAYLSLLKAETLGLTERQRSFCNAYLTHFNATRAYKEAGYTAKNDNVAAASASALLKRPQVIEYLRTKSVEAAERVELTLDYVLRKVKDRLEVRITDVADIGRHGDLTIKDLNKVPKEAVAAIAEISSTFTEEGPKLKLKMKDDGLALRLAAKYTGLTDDWNSFLRIAGKYGYTVRKTDSGYELLDTYTAPQITDDAAELGAAKED